VVDRFLTSSLAPKLLERFMTTLDCVDVAFIGDQTHGPAALPSAWAKLVLAASTSKRARAEGAECRARSRAPSRPASHGHFTPGAVNDRTADGDYTQRRPPTTTEETPCQELDHQVGSLTSVPTLAASMRTVTALLVLREHVIGPLLAGASHTTARPKPATWTLVDQHYQQLRLDMQPLFQELGIAA